MRILITSIVDIKRVTHNRIHVFADYLSREHDVTILCLNAWWLDQGGNDRGSAHYHDDPYFQQLFERARILYLTNGRQPPLLQELVSLWTLGALMRQIDLASFDVHVNYSNLLAGYVVTREARRLGIPTVFDMADDLPHSFALSPRVAGPLRLLAGLVAHRMLQANVNLATRVTFVTEALRDAYRLPATKSILIPNGVHESLLTGASDPSLREGLGLDGSFVLGFLGTLLGWVDLEPAFVAVSRLTAEGKDVKMLVVGGGEKLEASRRLAAQHAVSDKVVFTNQVSLRDVPSYLSCVDVGLICRAQTPDSDRSLPLKLLEYMACGKPVISVPLAGVREAVGDRVLYAADGEELARRVMQLHEDRALGERLGLQGRQFVRDRYSWSDICRRFEAALLDVAGGGVGP
jgi:glycosyltransferase involved in cell wall biosynthesis